MDDRQDEHHDAWTDGVGDRKRLKRTENGLPGGLAFTVPHQLYSTGLNLSVYVCLCVCINPFVAEFFYTLQGARR